MLFELASLASLLASAIVNVIGFQLLRSQNIARNVKVLLDMLLFLVGHASIVVLRQLRQVVIPTCLVLKLRRLNRNLYVAIKYLISVKILYHHVQIILVILQYVGRLAVV